jgi:hypothetical protein
MEKVHGFRGSGLWFDGASLAIHLAFAEVEFCTTGAELLAVHFIRKNFFFLSAGVAFAHERLQIFIGLKSGAVLGCICHGCVSFM